jgi:hypothetical protein
MYFIFLINEIERNFFFFFLKKKRKEKERKKCSWCLYENLTVGQRNYEVLATPC